MKFVIFSITMSAVASTAFADCLVNLENGSRYGNEEINQVLSEKGYTINGMGDSADNTYGGNYYATNLFLHFERARYEMTVRAELYTRYAAGKKTLALGSSHSKIGGWLANGSPSGKKLAESYVKAVRNLPDCSEIGTSVGPAKQPDLCRAEFIGEAAEQGGNFGTARILAKYDFSFPAQQVMAQSQERIAEITGRCPACRDALNSVFAASMLLGEIDVESQHVSAAQNREAAFLDVQTASAQAMTACGFAKN